MTDQRLEISQKDERAIEAALEHLSRATGSATPASLPADLPAAEVARWVEALSLLSYSVEPAAPSPRVREELMQQVRAEPKAAPVDMTLRQVTQPGAAPGAAAPEDPADMTLFGLGGDAPLPVPANDHAGLRRAAWLLAAGLVLCLVGLGYLYGQLEADRHAGSTESAELRRVLEYERQRSRMMEDRLEMVTTVARAAYPMHRVATGPASHDAADAGRSADSSAVERAPAGSGEPDGIIYVCGQHQRWYLSLENLEPPPAGQDYHLWFLTGGGEVDAGPLDVADDGSVDVQDLEMPDDTHGFLVSLEDAEAPPAPQGQVVLRADQSVRL